MGYIQGRELPGFFGIFERSYGDPETERPMRTITPSFIGNAMLPFRCPGCGTVPQELACPFTREHYRDTREGRTNHFCPTCGCRFKINTQGAPLPCTIEAGAVVGPSLVERGGVTTWQDNPSTVLETTHGDTMIGAISNRSNPGYIALALARQVVGGDDDETVFGAGGIMSWWRSFAAPRRRAPTPKTSQVRLPARGVYDEVFTAPSRVLVFPPKGACTVFMAPRSASFRGGVRKVPPKSFSADTVNYEFPQELVVVTSDGSVVRVAPEKATFVQVFHGRSSRA